MHVSPKTTKLKYHFYAHLLYVLEEIDVTISKERIVWKVSMTFFFHLFSLVGG